MSVPDPQEQAKITYDEHTIGYWCGIHGLTFDDLSGYSATNAAVGMGFNTSTGTRCPI